MSEEGTQPPFQTEPPTNQTKTETTIETIETGFPPHDGRRPGELFGMSGRFWIAFLAVSFAGSISVIALLKDKLDPQMLGMILGGFLALAGNICSTYLGQNAGPTKPKPS